MNVAKTVLSYILHTVLTIVIVGIGWVLFSVQGVIPQSLSLPVPSPFQSYNSPLYVTGKTFRNELIEISKQNAVAPGTFSSLNLFDDGNFINKCYFDTSSKKLYFGLGEASYSFSVNDLKFDTVCKEEYECILPLESYEMAFDPDDGPSLFHKGAHYQSPGWRYYLQEYNKTTKEYALSIECILKELLRSETEHTTPVDLSALVHMVYTGVLQHWDPVENIAVIRVAYEQGDIEFVRYDLNQPITDVSHEGVPYVSTRVNTSALSYTMAISNNSIMGYNQETATVEWIDLVTGERRTLVSDVPSLTYLTYAYTVDGEFVISGLFADNKWFVDYRKQDGVCVFHSDTPMYYVYMDDVNVILVKADDKGNPKHFGYNVDTHESKKAMEG